jgi:hypothetical protein
MKSKQKTGKPSKARTAEAEAQAKDTTISLFESSAVSEPIGGQVLTSFLVAGIVNPFGPTLTAVVAAGELQPGATLSVIHMMLNPFAQDAQTVGELTVGNRWQPAAIVRELFDLPFGCCPSLLVPSAHLTVEEAVEVHAEFLRRFDGARRLLKRIKQRFGNPWDRISEEMDAVKSGNAQSVGYGSNVAAEPLDEGEAREFAGLLLSKQHMVPEFQAFMDAWDGSITFQRDQGAAAMADAAMSWQVFQKVFRRITGG